MIVQSTFKYLYGPVFSWRLGMSLGIDPLSDKSKICNMDCVYCQLGRTVYWSNERQNYVPTDAVINEIKALAPMELDYITFSGRGEPTLAANLGEMIIAIRKIRTEKIAVITNSILMTDAKTRADLSLADMVLAKLDACDQQTLDRVDKAMAHISFFDIVEGIKMFRKEYRGRMALQLMFVKGNLDAAPQMAKIADSIGADEIEINTPLRPSAEQPLSEQELTLIKNFFTSADVKTVYEMERKTVVPMNERDAIKRHGNYKKQK